MPKDDALSRLSSSVSLRLTNSARVTLWLLLLERDFEQYSIQMPASFFWDLDD